MKNAVLEKNLPVFDLALGQIKEAGVRAEKNINEALSALVSIPSGQRTFENTLLAFENAVNDYSDAVTIPIFLGYVSGSKEIAEAANGLELRVQQFSIEIYAREDVFRALDEYAAQKTKPGPVESRLLEKTLLEFKRNGLGLSAEKRQKVKELKQKLVDLEIQFEKNIRETRDFMEVSAGQLKGLSEEYINKLQKTDSGKYVVTTDYPDYVPFMENADNGEARKTIESKFNNRCADKNVALLEDAIKLRHEIAGLLGFPSHAAYNLEDRMAKDPDRVIKFLEELHQRLVPKGEKELAERLELKKKESAIGRLAAWEWRYYNNLLKKTKYKLDHEKIREYFPMETVLSGMMKLFGDILGADFKLSSAPKWHPDVRVYEITDRQGGGLAGYFYLDLFPREGKYKHAACFGLVRGRQKTDNTWQCPAGAIVSNFNKPSADAPSLFSHEEVVTLFHEFGHITHGLFTRVKYGSFSGTSVSRDFVEVPSKMLEYWAYYPEVLRMISGHWKNPSEKLPEDVIEKLIADKNMDSGLMYLRQVFFSLLDMKYHTAGSVNTTELYRTLMESVTLMPMSPGVHPQASFGHLMGGYDAGYYGYLWAEVMAADMFSVFVKNGITDTVTGKKYRDLILATGRSCDELEQVEKFLGRKPEQTAFLKSIGLEV